MNKKNLITLAVVLVVGYLLWNMSNKQQQQTPQQACVTGGGAWQEQTDGTMGCTAGRYRRR